MIVIQSWPRTKSVFCVFSVFITMILVQVSSLSGPNMCMVQQKYNITKRVKYRAPMSVRTYEWCFSMPPRCSRWKTEMRDLTRLETEERMAEVAVCCPGYKMKDVSCVPICPNGKTGNRCTEECPPNKWGPNCINECAKCLKGFCSPITGRCECLEGWQGESCNIRMTTMSPPALMEELLTTTKSTVQTTHSSTKPNIPMTRGLETTTAVTTLPLNRSFYLKPDLNNITETSTKASFSTKTVPDMFNVTFVSRINKNNEGPAAKKTLNAFIYNRTETPTKGTSNSLTTAHATSKTIKIPLTTKTISTQKPFTIATPTLTSTSTVSTSRASLPYSKELTITTEIIRKADTVSQSSSTVTKLKPKEIWIKPTQKGISTEYKIKVNHDLTNFRGNGTKNDVISEITTPRTIIVSIIPTSVSHATFKKIAFTTVSYTPLRANVTLKKHKIFDPEKNYAGSTKSMSVETTTQAPFTIKILSTLQRNLSTSSQSTNVTNPVFKHTSRKSVLNASFSHTSTSSTKMAVFNTPTSTVKSTNSMSGTSSTSTVKKILKTSNAITLRPSTNITSKLTTKGTINLKDETKYLKDDIFKIQESSLQTTTLKSITSNITGLKTNIFNKQTIKVAQKNITKTVSNVLSTETPTEDETFHILTEPEHITAVMSEKEKENSSLDLISVVSVVGGIMMAVITVAVIIVMFERCRRPRYEDVRKINDIRMQVMIDNADVPPPYVRSIFHTPLPDPPQSEKCHYQPISTLDRNLKQFMRPVVVQNISPIMLENFRGILECHYDHLPRRSHDIGISARSSTQSMMDGEKLSLRTNSMADSVAPMCEAKLDVLDHTSSEPLYAEIPCWRPPSEHAVEVINLNGEAVTEL